MRKIPFGTFNLIVYRDSPPSGGVFFFFFLVMSSSKVFYEVEIVRKKIFVIFENISIIFLFLILIH